MVDYASLLRDIPERLRSDLIAEFQKIESNFRRGNWEAAELDGGRLCEVAFAIVKGHVDGQFPQQASKPDNFKVACERLAQADQTKFSRSVRLTLPRMLVSLYDVRNQRGVGHIGGDVDASHMDSVLVLYMAKWIVAELIRIFHGVDTSTASAAVDLLVEREIPLIWNIAGRKRVLEPSMSAKDKALLLLFGESKPQADRDLCSWVEYSSFSHFKSKVLAPLHQAKLVEYDTASGQVYISVLGVQHAEGLLVGRQIF